MMRHPPPVPVARAAFPLCRRPIALLALACSSAPALADHHPDADALARMSIEQLLDTEVYSASRYLQSASDAPSAVSVVTSEDISRYGWRTLSDVLRAMPGLYVNYDRNYSYLGARGFQRLGDYNTRFLLLVDGQRTNDAVYDQASIGTEFLIDVDLIDRVEYVPGPGSSIHGSNAFFGVINVMTKRARDLPRAQVSGEIGRFSTRKARATLALQSESGAELLLSATRYRSGGGDLYYPQFDTPGVRDGIARGLDHDLANSFFSRGSAGPFSFTLAHAERTKGVPTASWGQDFNDPRSATSDVQSHGRLAYRNLLGSGQELHANLSYGRYRYEGDYVYGGAVQRDGSDARWGGIDMRLVSTAFAGHKLVAGFEHSIDTRRNQYNYIVAPHAPGLDDRRRGRSTGVFIQDEMALSSKLLLNAGLRWDSSEVTSSIFNPRLALIYKPSAATVIKAIAGSAYRDPNAYEMYYQSPPPGAQSANPNLRPERIRTRELVLEQRIGQSTRVSATLYQNIVSNLITQVTDPGSGNTTFTNFGEAIARGVELALDRAWQGGTRLRASTLAQHIYEGTTGSHPVNSPRWVAKLNLTLPAWVTQAGLEAQYVAPRNTLLSAVPGYLLVNATLLAKRLGHGLEGSVSIYNLLDRRFADPGGAEHVQDSLTQDGRSWRLKLTYGF